ncbi:multiprotein-bridging factor 1 family protein [Streptomyces sp. NPDC057579]|uniref:helix-turn-helix domain-containing protein n=1 Tax=Streptomyces sp. NPDC057579 TaxID=3346172 RepID=UPI00369B11E5
MDAQDEEITVEQAGENFAAEVARWREVRGMSKRALAQAMGFGPSYVSHVESGRHRPREEFARLADESLNAGKAIWRRWCDYGLRQFTWITTTPALHARYRLEWRFRAQPEPDTDQGEFR